MRRVARFSCALVFLCACSSADRDTIRELNAVEDLRIDANAENLSPIIWLAVARDGGIVISQDQDGGVLFLGADGRRVGFFGRSGDGPGEFRHVSRYGWRGDTLWIGDVSAKRTTYVHPDRSLVRTALWPSGIEFDSAATGPSPTFFWVPPAAIYPDGSQLTEPMLAVGSAPALWLGPEDHSIPLVLVTAGGSFMAVAARIPGHSCTVRYGDRVSSGSATIPFCARPAHAVSATGSRVAIALPPARDSDADTYRVVAANDRGDTLFTRSYRFTPQPIPRQLIDSIITQRVVGASSPEQKDAFRSMTPPANYPPFSRILVGRDETIWIELYTTTGDRVWNVLGADGDGIGHVRLPRSVQVMVASREAVWGTDTDDDGLQHVVRYSVTDPP